MHSEIPRNSPDELYQREWWSKYISKQIFIKMVFFLLLQHFRKMLKMECSGERWHETYTMSLMDYCVCVAVGGKRKAADDAVSAFFIFSHSFMLVLPLLCGALKTTQRENQKICSRSSRWEQATIICGFCDVISAKWSLLKSSEETCGHFLIFQFSLKLLSLQEWITEEAREQSSIVGFSLLPNSPSLLLFVIVRPSFPFTIVCGVNTINYSWLLCNAIAAKSRVEAAEKRRQVKLSSALSTSINFRINFRRTFNRDSLRPIIAVRTIKYPSSNIRHQSGSTCTQTELTQWTYRIQQLKLFFYSSRCSFVPIHVTFPIGWRKLTIFSVKSCFSDDVINTSRITKTYQSTRWASWILNIYWLIRNVSFFIVMCPRWASAAKRISIPYTKTGWKHSSTLNLKFIPSINSISPFSYSLLFHIDRKRKDEICHAEKPLRLKLSG